MSTSWSGVVDVGEEEQSETKEDRVVGLGITVGDAAVAEDSIVII